MYGFLKRSRPNVVSMHSWQPRRLRRRRQNAIEYFMFAGISIAVCAASLILRFQEYGCIAMLTGGLFVLFVVLVVRETARYRHDAHAASKIVRLRRVQRRQRLQAAVAHLRRLCGKENFVTEIEADRVKPLFVRFGFILQFVVVTPGAAVAWVYTQGQPFPFECVVLGLTITVVAITGCLYRASGKLQATQPDKQMEASAVS